MRSDNTDIEALTLRADTLDAPTLDEDAMHAAARTIERLAPDPVAALTALAAFGLADPYQPIPGIPDAKHSTRRYSAATTHGTAAAVQWHQDQRIPVCGACQRWAQAHPEADAKTGV